MHIGIISMMTPASTFRPPIHAGKPGAPSATREVGADTDWRYIQVLQRAKSRLATVIYARVSIRNTQNIQSTYEHV
jgi:hypothetical protein